MKTGVSVLALIGWSAALGADPTIGAAHPPAAFLLSLGAEGMVLDASLRGASGDEVGFHLDIQGEGATLRGRARLEGVSGRPLFLAGPGEASGPLRFLAAPLSAAEVFVGGEAARLDRSMESGTGIALLQGDRYFAFAALRGGGGRPWTLGSLPALGGEPAASGGMARADVAGACGLRIPAGDGELGLVVSADARGESPASGGWSPDRSADPGGLSWRGALSYARSGVGSRGAFGLAASAGERDAPGLALRAEAEARSGPIAISAIAGAASREFRDVYGRSPAAEIVLGARFAALMPAFGGASATTEVSGSVGARGIVAAEAAPRLRWERRAAVDFSWSTGEENRLAASLGLAERGGGSEDRPDFSGEETGGLAVASASGVEPVARLDLSFDRKRERWSFSLFESGALRAAVPVGSASTGKAGTRAAELRLEVASRLSLGGRSDAGTARPGLAAVSAELGVACDAAGRVRALGSARLDLPAAEGASLRLALGLPEEGFVLGVAGPGGGAEGPRLSLLYRAEPSPGRSP